MQLNILNLDLVLMTFVMSCCAERVKKEICMGKRLVTKFYFKALKYFYHEKYKTE